MTVSDCEQLVVVGWGGGGERETDRQTERQAGRDRQKEAEKET